LLAQLISEFASDQRPLFVAEVEGPGFPFLLPRTSLEVVEQQLKRRRWSLQALSKSLGARLLRPTAQQRYELLNINTPEDFQKARRQWKQLGQWSRRNQESG
jgi:molybdopterin-guanine dinucleotide biosynthesis protein A